MTDRSTRETLTLASISIIVLVYSFLPSSSGTRWLGRSDTVVAVAETLKDIAEQDDNDN